MNPNDDQSDDHTVATYLSDMLALERHINVPIDEQLSSADHQESGTARIVQRIHSVATSHISALEAQLKAAGDSPSHGLKEGWSRLIGGGAAALNSARKTKVSKSLRDDYAALNLAAISYTMLHATATGLGDLSTAALAKSHLDDITPIIIDISTAIPGVVLQELAADGEAVDITAAQQTQQVTKEAWGGSAS